MDEDFENYSKLKESAFSKFDKLQGNIRNITIGPESIKYHLNIIRLENGPKSEIDSISPSTTTTNSNSNEFGEVIWKEYETKRQQEVENNVRRYCQRLEEHNSLENSQTKQQWDLKQKAFAVDAERQEHEILKILELSDGNRRTECEKLRSRYQDLVRRKQKIQEEENQIREMYKMKLEKINVLQEQFNSIYKKVITILQKHGNTETIAHILQSLENMPSEWKSILQSCKTGRIEDKLVKKACQLLEQINAISLSLEQNEETNSRELEKKNEPEITVNTSEVPDFNPNLFISPSNLKRYSETKCFMENHQTLYQELLNDEKLKQFRFDCKKAVNIPVNSLSMVTSEHLQDKYVKLHHLLSGNRVEIGGKVISAADHPQGIAFCTDLLARKFVLQGDMIISSSLDMAYCYATIIVSLWNDFPDFGQLFLGYVYLQCPYLVPFYIPRTEGDTDEDFYKSRGYQYVNGQVETQVKFLKRMTGIMRLYFAILIAKPHKAQEKNPHNATYAWKWLSSIVKLEPELDITATALHTFLETIGFALESIYGLMFKKVLNILINDFIPKLKKIDSGGPVSRLEVLLEEYSKNNQFTKPKGVLPPNFW